jgi:hypothetical protein
MPVPADWSQRPKKAVEEWESSPDSYGRLYDKLFDSFVLAEEAESWEDFYTWSNEVQGWGFRGQREAAWTLRTSLEREIRVQYSHGNGTGVYHLDRKREERELLFRFQQQTHHYIRHLPSSDDLASWFALMQHHGVPTRLLDWTQSPYVAMYFAVEEEARGEQKCCAVWAIDVDWLESKGQEVLRAEAAKPMPDDAKTRIQYLNSLLSQKEKPLIVRIDPLQANERMFAQQGFFLWKLFEEVPFFDQILMSMMLHPELTNRPVVRKLYVADRHRIEFLEKLRVMNVHRASLFPGLDGFCQSLKLDLQIKVERARRHSSLYNGETING